MDVEEWWNIITPFLPSIPSGLRLAVIRSKLRGDARSLNAQSIDELKRVLLTNYPSTKLKVTALTGFNPFVPATFVDLKIHTRQNFFFTFFKISFDNNIISS